MDDLTINDTLDHDFQAKPPSAVFLIVICIISWVEHGISMLNGLKDLAFNGFQKPSSNINDLMSQEDLDVLDGFGNSFINSSDIGAMVDQAYYQSWITAVGGLLVCVFVLLMFLRKKSGFVLYAITMGLIMTASIYMTVNFAGSGSFLGGFMMVAVGFSVIHHGVSIFLFSRNVKHLTK
ncbi:MAG: hypothetical protein JKY54_04460 [Flavobacteriales bacterium]|nr:hypothetical protein [Flavobacteriales bacterium]